tara:strand:- start:132 stop:596 length:465 start_codon:yes stop_codon:yes gene_type:complete
MKFLKNLLNVIALLFFSVLFSKVLLAQEFGSKDEAIDLLERTENLIKVDKHRALELIVSGEGGLHPKDLYPFCLNDQGVLVAHPTNIGGNIMEFKDSSGKYVGKEMIAIAKYGEINTVDFIIARLTTNDEKEYKKTQLVKRMSGLICVVGYYTQ